MGITVFQDRIWVAGGLSKNVDMPVYRSVLNYDTLTDRYLCTCIRDFLLYANFLFASSMFHSYNATFLAGLKSRTFHYQELFVLL